VRQCRASSTGCPGCCLQDLHAVPPFWCCCSPLRVVGDRTGSSALAGGGGLLAAAAMLASTSRYSSLHKKIVRQARPSGRHREKNLVVGASLEPRTKDGTVHARSPCMQYTHAAHEAPAPDLCLIQGDVVQPQVRQLPIKVALAGVV
jgi:hypothetical protein